MRRSHPGGPALVQLGQVVHAGGLFDDHVHLQQNHRTSGRIHPTDTAEPQNTATEPENTATEPENVVTEPQNPVT